MYKIGMAKAIQIDDKDNVATVTSEVSMPGLRPEKK